MLLIQNGTIHTMEEEKPIRADLLIRDGKIAKIDRKINLQEGMTVISGEVVWSAQ